MTLFISAALLFSIQPMFTKMVLPMLGGAPAVWNTAMVFFQGILLLSYTYAHLLSQGFRFKQQVIIHGVVLFSAIVFLPITVMTGWTPPADNTPSLWLLSLFFVSVGAPFFVVSATAPLLQRWFSYSNHHLADNPYFLYSASNLGSILALLSYPLLAEPLFKLQEQSYSWSAGYGVLVILILLCAISLLKSSNTAGSITQKQQFEIVTVEWSTRLRWVILAFIPSSLLIGVTLYITTDVVAAPLFWVIPLSLYLLTFVIVFSIRPVIKHSWMLRLQPIVVIPVAIIYGMGSTNWIIFAPLHILLFFVNAMVCHGELALSRPKVHHLTEFYLWMSLGGVFGGIFSALLAPVLFDSVIEYPLMIALACMLRPGMRQQNNYQRLLDWLFPAGLLLFVMALTNNGTLSMNLHSVTYVVIALMIVGTICYSFVDRPIRMGLGVAVVVFCLNVTLSSDAQLIERGRSFFGVHKVMLEKSGQYKVLYHGTTIHGAQYTDPEKQKEPLTYYHKNSPIGQIFETLNATNRLQRVALAGLGTGAISCYKLPEQEWTIYEIDPLVVKYAQEPDYFSYLSHCAKDALIVMGDARLSLNNAPDNYFDLVIMDVFSSDAIPVHLATREAIAMYFKKLAPGGLVVLHISNRYLNLEGIIANIMLQSRLEARIQVSTVNAERERESYIYGSTWVVAAKQENDLDLLDYRWRPLKKTANTDTWTDDFSNIINLMW